MPVGLQIWEATGDDARSLLLVHANPECERQVGFELTPLAGRPIMDIFPAAPAERLYEAAVAGEPRTLEFRYEGDDRLPLSWWRLKLAPYGGRRVLVSVTNITRAKAHERSLRASERLNRSILAGLQEGVVVVDTNARIVLANAAAAELLGADELVGRALTSVPVDLLDDRGRLLPDDRLPLSRALRGQQTRGQIVRFVRRTGCCCGSVGVLMLDLDGFKGVNDRRGHAAGDEVLREVARRLRRSVRERDLVARLGGDEFVVVLTDLGAVPDAVDRVEAALAEPFALADAAPAPLRAAVGVAVFPADGATVADLLAVADREMYAAKGSRSLR